jgi:hypothetical protein
MNSFAATAVAIKGKVTKISDGIAVIKAEKYGDVKVALKHVNKKDAAKIRTAAASKKEVRVMLMASQMKQDLKKKKSSKQ